MAAFNCLKPSVVEKVEIPKLNGDWFEQFRMKGSPLAQVCETLTFLDGVVLRANQKKVGKSEPRETMEGFMKCS